MEDCIFCKIVAGKMPCYKIYEDDFVLAFLDISNDGNGHTLVIPKKHCENILDCDDKTLTKVFEAVKKISLHYVQNCGATGVNLLNASGKDAEQSVFHLHIHILPRFKGDNLKVFPTLEKNQQTLQEIQEKLKMM